MPFLVGAWAGTVRLDERWLGNLATVVVGGIMQGGVNAMFALGLTLIFGVMRIINAADGEMVMMGAYLTWVAFFYLGVDPLLSIVLTLPIAFVFGQNRVISFVLAVAISTAVYLFLKLSRLGKAVRATALNAEVAMVCGIDVRRIYLITTGLAAALAVAGGALVSIQFGFNPETGVLYTLQAFAIIVLGGGGRYPGALIGGLMLAGPQKPGPLLVPPRPAPVAPA